jgi:L-malate glycosyltransferase
MQTKRLRVLHVNPERGWGGGEQQVLGLIEYLERQGHSCHLACDPGGLLRRRASQRGIATVDLTIRNDLALGAAWRLRRILGDSSWNILHLHTRKAQVMSLYLPKARGFRVVATRRMDYEVKRDRFHRRLYRGVDRVIAVSNAVKDVLIRGGVDPESVRVAHSGVDASRIEAVDPVRVAEFRQRACVGPSTRKGHDVLLRAIRILREAGEDIACIAAGEGPLRQYLDHRIHELGIADRVHLMGFVDDMASFYRALDLFVLPSNKEAMGNSLMEAMLAEVPVVASRVGGSTEIVEEGLSGMLFPAGDSPALAERIGGLLRNRELRERLSRAGRARVLSRFTIERMAETNERYYYEVLNESSA